MTQTLRHTRPARDDEPFVQAFRNMLRHMGKWVGIPALILVLLMVIGSTCADAAVGDILSVTIAADSVNNGFVAEIKIAELDSGGTYDIGLGDNNDPAAASIVLTVTSPGFDANGDSTTIERTIYGTAPVVNLYPENATENETIDGDSVTVRVSLSDFIYASDTATISIGSGFYTQGGNPNNAVSDMAVTNSSTMTYPKVVGNWSYPGWNMIRGNSFNVRMVGFHRSARNGQPLRAVKFIATDEHANADTVVVTAATIDDDMPDAVPVIEFIGTLDATNLTQGDLVTVNFIAYPWVGDSGSILNTGDGVNTMPTPLYAPQYWLNDKSGSYGITVAWVDSATGNDGTGAAIDSTSFDAGSPPNPFATIGAASAAIAAYNNTNHSRNNAAGGVIFINTGTYTFPGAEPSTADGNAWVTIKPFPGAERSGVIIASSSGTKQISEKLKLENITITNSSVGGYDQLDYLWLDQCAINADGLATFYRNTCNYYTHNLLYNGDDNILGPFSTAAASRVLVRGNITNETFSTAIVAYTILGNDMTMSSYMSFDYAGQTIPTFDNVIIAYNFITETGATRIVDHLKPAGYTMTHGAAIVQNVFEQTVSTVSPLVQIAADGSDETNNPVNNILVWHNNIIGQRINMAYNDVAINGAGPSYRLNWSFVGNIIDDYNIVGDGDSHSGTVDGTGYGNRSLRYGVGYAGNVFLEREDTAGYMNFFTGIASYDTTNGVPGYTTDASYYGTGEGGGDYALIESSPAINLIPSGMAVLPYDIVGNARYNDGTGDAGAYEAVFTIEEASSTPVTNTNSWGNDTNSYADKPSWGTAW